MNRIAVLGLVLLLQGCVQYSLVETRPYTVKSITVTPGIIWNKVPTTHVLFPGASAWTVDGANLNALYFFFDIENGDSIFRAPKNAQLPVYRSEMLPTEIAELAESTLSKFLNMRIIGTGELNPFSIADLNGVEYTFEMAGQDSPVSKVYLVAVSEGEKLQMILFQATRLHYFDQHIEEVKKLVATATIEG